MLQNDMLLVLQDGRCLCAQDEKVESSVMQLASNMEAVHSA